MIFDAIFYALAILAFLLAAWGRVGSPVGLGWLGLAFFALPSFVHAAGWA
jgi:hypothetical protein